MTEAADRIEALTAERDVAIKWWGESTELTRQARLQYSDEKARAEAAEAERDQWIAHTKNAVWADSEELKLAEAERDRLRAIGTEMAESIEGNYYLPGVATRWFAALKGESHE